MVGSAHPTSVSKIAYGCGKYQRGVSLVAAVFIIVVLAILGLMMVTIGGMERATAVAAAQGARAYYAARAGIEWGTYQAMPPTSSCVAISPLPLGPPTPPTFSLTVPGLSGYNVWVDCAKTQHRERGDTYFVYVITSTATFSTFGTADYISRTLRVSVTDVPP
jgi:MSHA biogenesis protein MshP